MDGALSVLPLCLHGIHGNDCNNKNMANLIGDTSATRCVTFIEVTFLKKENNNIAVVPNFWSFGLTSITIEPLEPNVRQTDVRIARDSA